jgi:3-(3-hydroxy-phenyl)propionate hydroxylase
VGAGPIGLTVANLLVRYGVDVLLIERNPTTVQEPRGVSIDDEALRTMQSIGAVTTILNSVVLGYGSDYFTPGGTCFLSVHPTTREYGYPRRSAFRQPVLERQLAEHFISASRTNRSESWFETELREFRQTGETVELVVRHADGTEKTVSTRYLIGCDGGRSFVREKLGIRMSGSTFRERWLILDLEDTHDETRDTKVFCNPARPCISLPGPSKTRRFEFMLHDGETEAEVTAPAFVQALLRKHGEENTPLRRSRVYTFHARMADRWRDGRIFLAGDAAHLTPPFAGQGMNSGVRDAHNLAWKVAAVLQGRLGPSVLDTYEQERRSHAWRMITLAIRMGKVMMPRHRWSAFALAAAFRALGIVPRARSYFGEMKYKPKPRLGDGFFQRDKNQDLPGRLFPQPTVEAPEGETLLDEVLGDGFALLAPPHTPPAIFDQLPEGVWRNLKPRLVAVRPSGDAAAVPDGVIRVMDQRGEFTRLLPDLPVGLVLIRPDRYTAALLRRDHLQADFRELDALITKTGAPLRV